jgi:hypothetical protein
MGATGSASANRDEPFQFVGYRRRMAFQTALDLLSNLNRCWGVPAGRGLGLECEIASQTTTRCVISLVFIEPWHPTSTFVRESQ